MGRGMDTPDPRTEAAWEELKEKMRRKPKSRTRQKDNGIPDAMKGQGATRCRAFHNVNACRPQTNTQQTDS